MPFFKPKANSKVLPTFVPYILLIWLQLPTKYQTIDISLQDVQVQCVRITLSKVNIVLSLVGHVEGSL